MMRFLCLPAALGLVLMGIPAVAAPSNAAPQDVGVGADGSVADVPTDGTPAVTNVRVLAEGKFLEIDWNEYVDEEAAVDPANITLTNGGKEMKLTAKPDSGPTNTIFFDKDNKQVAATDAQSMKLLSDDVHKASIAYTGSFDPSKSTTVSVKGSKIKDADGNGSTDQTYTGVPRVSFYTQRQDTSTGITVKADPSVKPVTIKRAASQVEHQLSKPGTGIAEAMAARKCTLAVYGARHNAYMVPEHREWYDPETYDVEGFGGTVDGCVSSISERNVNRVKDDPDPLNRTLYKDENILAHEFGHAVRLVGIDTQKDQTLSEDFYKAYKNAYESGLWPNTYAISNSDEYFGVLTTIWFDSMAERPDWEDGVRNPINTRAELKKYDPKGYEIMSRIYPKGLMPAPWDEPGPDEYHDEKVSGPTASARVSAKNVDLEKDDFRIETFDAGVSYQVDLYTCDPSKPQETLCMSEAGGDGTWKIAYDNGSYVLTSVDNGEVLTAGDGDSVTTSAPTTKSADASQRWRLAPDVDSDDNAFSGTLINEKTGKALGIGRSFPGRDQGIIQTAPENATRWMLNDTTVSDSSSKDSYLRPVTIRYEIGSDLVPSTVAAQFFTLPDPEDLVDGKVKDGFRGWSLKGSSKILDDSWTLPKNKSDVTLVARFKASSPTDTATPTASTDPTSDTSQPSSSAPTASQVGTTDSGASPTRDPEGDGGAAAPSSGSGHAAAGDDMADTGADSLPWVGVGAAALALGGALVLWSRMRRRH